MSGLRRWFTRIGPDGRDWLLAGTLALLSEIELFVTGATRGPLLLNALVLALLTLPLAWRRRYPLGVAACCFVVVVVQTAFLTTIDNLISPFLPLLVVAYTVAAVLDQPKAGAGLLLCLTGVVAVNLLAEEQASGSDYFFPGMFMTIAWLCGRAVRTHSRLTEELHEAAVRAREAGEEHARGAAADERRRIAREMHDVVAHSVSVMVVQAGGARRILERDPARAVEAARRIEETGRAAMAEMRTLLGILHLADDEGVRAPQPTLQHLGALVAHARAAGLPVELREEGAPRALPAGIDLAAYRIVQEGLTNALKHAGSPTQVTVRWGEHDLQLTIADSGPGPARAASANGGHGLVGMAERVRIYGGELETGRRSGGGFEVTARLPL